MQYAAEAEIYERRDYSRSPESHQQEWDYCSDRISAFHRCILQLTGKRLHLEEISPMIKPQGGKRGGRYAGFHSEDPPQGGRAGHSGVRRDDEGL